MKKLIAILVSISIFISGCASTVAVPVPVAQVGDETKSCDAITNEMQKMITAQIEADGNRDKQIGVNSALAVAGVFLIVPWFFMDLGGAASAEQKAAKARYERLEQMLIDKKCSNTPSMKPDATASNSNTQSSVAYPSTNPKSDDALNPVKRLDDLNTLLKKELITQKEYDIKKAEILKNL